MCLTLRSFVSRLVPLFWVQTIHFQLQCNRMVLSFAKMLFWIGVGYIYIYIHLIKEGPTFKPKSSKLGTHQGQNSFTSGYYNPFKTNILRHVWPPQISRLVPLLLAEILCFHVKATHIQKHYFEKWYGKPM